MCYYYHMKSISYKNFFLDRNFLFISEKVYNLLQSHSIQPVILAGGKSTRMKEPKALLTVGEHTLLSRIATGMQEVFATPPFIITNTPELFDSFGYPMWTDLHPHHGPLSGLETALHYSRRPYIYVTPCDAAYFSVPLAIALCEELMEQTSATTTDSIQAILPAHHKKTGAISEEPLYGLYHTSCLPAIQQSLHAETFAVRSALDHIQYHTVLADAYEHAFLNINTPADIQYVRTLFKNNKQHDF